MSRDLIWLVIVSCVSSFQEVKVKECSDMERFSEYEALLRSVYSFNPVKPGILNNRHVNGPVDKI